MAVELQRHRRVWTPPVRTARGVCPAASRSCEPARDRIAVTQSAPSMRELLRAIAYEANRTVGGGLVSIELLRRRFTASGWLDAASHGVFIAVSRSPLEPSCSRMS